MYNICDRTRFCPSLHWCNFFGWILLAQCHFQYDLTMRMQAFLPFFFFFNQCTELRFHCLTLFLGNCNFTFPLLLLLWSFRYCRFLLCTFHAQTFLCFKSVFCFRKIKLFKLNIIWGKQDTADSCLTSVLFYAFLKSMNSRHVPPIDPHLRVGFCFAFSHCQYSCFPCFGISGAKRSKE